MTRSRNRAEPESTAAMTRYVNDNPQSDVVDTVLKQQTEAMVDVVTPGFHRRSAEGEVINNPCTYSKSSFNVTGAPQSDYYAKVGATEYRGSGDGCLTTALAVWLFQLGQSHNIGSLPDVPEPNFDMESACKLTALSNVDRAPYAFMEDAFEIRETIRFLRNPVASLYKLAKLFNQQIRKKGILSIRDKAKQAKAIADVWLQYRFAFSPLVRSINDALEAFNDNSGVPERRTARGFESYIGGETLDDILTNYDWTSTRTLVEEHSAGILYETTNPFWGWRNKYGLGFKNIPETLWAIVPYSFMVDRLVNISASIRALTVLADPSVKILAGWHTVKRTSTSTRSCYNYKHPKLKALTFIPDTEVSEDFTYDRDVWEPTVGDAIPMVEWKNVINSTAKVADLLALIVQNVKLV